MPIRLLRGRTSLRLTALFVAMLCPMASARAEGPGDKAAANALFEEGKRLSAEGKFAEACPKFEASLALVSRLGVALNLADCHEHTGKTASAWVAFGEAAAMAHRANDPRETFARERIAALVPRLIRIAITVPPASAVDALEVRRQGALVAPSLYGIEVPVDPGDYTIEAMAPGRLAWSTRVTAAREGDVLSVAIPLLSPVIAPEAPVASRAEPVPEKRAANDEGSPSRRRPPTATWIAAGTGIAGVAVGSAFGIAALTVWNRAKPDCNAQHQCSDAAFDDTLRARRYGNVATGAFVAGGAAFAIGAALYFTAPREADPRRAVRLAPTGSPGSIGLRLEGGF